MARPSGPSFNWFQSLYGAITKVTGGIWTRYGGQGWTRFRFLLPGSRFDYEREAGDLWMNPVVGLCLDWLGNRFPRPLIHVSRISKSNRDHVPLGRHPLIDLWNRPNGFYSRRTLEKVIGLSLKCDGNAYIYKVRDNGGKVVQLWWVPHYRILPTWPPDGSAYIDGYRVWLDSNVYWLPVDDIIHIRDGIDPRNERLGLCALRSNIREVCTINEESGYRAALLRNSCVPGLAVVPKGDDLRPTKEDADTIRASLHETTGGDNRGSTVVLGGPYDLVKIGYSPAEADLMDFPVVPTARILSSLGVAPMSLGLPDPGKTYANLAEANRSSWGTIVATQELVAEALRWELLPEFDVDPYEYLVEYDYTHIQELQESLDAVHTRAREDWKSGGITQNEFREMIGLEPDPDGDRWFPGTGSPEEQEQQDQQHQERLAVLQSRMNQPPPGRGKQDEEDEDEEPATNGKPSKNGEKRFGFYDFKFDASQPRDEGGRWTSGGHGGGGHKPSAGGGGSGSGGGTATGSRPSVAEQLGPIYAKAPEAKKEIDSLADHIAEKVDRGSTVAKAPLKGMARATEKVEKDYGGDASKITDIARNTIVAGEHQHADVVSMLKAKGAAVKVVKPGDDSLGYTGINAKIPTKAGLTAEMQVNTPHMIFAKEPPEFARAIIGEHKYNELAAKAKAAGIEGGMGHKFYEQHRSLPPGHPDGSKIAARSREYYDKIRRLGA